MISTSGMRCTGLKKCMPTKFSGAVKASARRVIEIVEVLLEITVPGLTDFSSSASTVFLTFSFSTTASTAKSIWLKSP